VPHDHRAPSAQASPRQATRRHLQVLAALALAPAAIGLASCASRGPSPSPVAKTVRLATVTRLPAIGTTVLAGPPDTLAASLARSLISSAPVVVIAPPGRPALLATAARLAVQAHAPLLLTAMTRASAIGSTASQAPPRTSVPALLSPAAKADIAALAPRYALAVGVRAAELAAELPHVRVVTDPARLPLVTRPRPQPLVTLLVHAHGGAAVTAAVTTAKATGAHLVRVTGFDPRADPKAIAALAAVRSRRIVAVGAGFGPARVLAARVDVAETGVQLPGGGQVLFPGHLLVALYGHPMTPSLGVLGHQLAFVRNIFGIVVIVIAGYVIYVFARYGSVSHETMAAYGLAWLLLLAGVRTVLVHWDGAYDARELGKRTEIRPVVFARFWLVGTLFALFLGTRLMM
jgi:nitroreductase